MTFLGIEAINHRGASLKRAVRNTFNRVLVGAALALLLNGCVGSLYSNSNQAINDQRPLQKSVQDLAAEEIETEVSEPVKFLGSDQMVNLPKDESPVQFVGDAVTLSFENAPLSEVTHAVLSDILGVDYLVDGPIKGEVTLRTRTPIARDNLLNVLESLLKANGTLLIRDSGNRYIVSSSAAAMKLAPRVITRGDKAAGHSVMIIPLSYISASGMAEILKPLADDSAFIRVDSARNLLMLAGTEAQLSGWLDIVDTFDVDMLEGMSVGLFPLQYSGVEELVEALNTLLEEASGDDAQGGLTDVVRVMPFIRLNSVLVITPRAHYLNKMEVWIERLDRAPENGAERRLYVYPVQNTTSGRLARLLNDIYSGGDRRGNDRNIGRDSQGVAPGLTRERVGGRSGGANADSQGAGSIGDAGGAGGASVSNLSLFDEGSKEAATDVRVVADEENNSLMIYSTGMQYKIIKSALDQLDTPPTQVLIEASIIEVTLNDALQYGLEWTFNGGLGGSRFSGIGAITDGAFDFAASPQLASGFSYTISGGAGDVVAVLQALASESLVNVISTPSVMVLDNNTASIQVGDQVPINGGTTVTNGGNTVSNISYKDTGIQLQVTPSVNAGGLVTIDVKQEVTDVGPIDVTGNRRFLQRSIDSRVAVRSGESVVLGGLIRENATQQDSGVPFLSGVPVVGALFGNQSQARDRTELLVIITPRALFNDAEVRSVSKEMREQVRELKLLGN